MSAKQKRVINFALCALLALTLAFIWGNSLLPRKESTALSGGLLAWLTPLLHALGLDQRDDHLLRKLAHFGEFTVLGMELAALFFLNRGCSRRGAAASALCAFAVAAADESLQALSDRAPMLRDVLLDCAGALTGIALLWLIWRRRETRRNENGLSG